MSETPATYSTPSEIYFPYQCMFLNPLFKCYSCREDGCVMVSGTIVCNCNSCFDKSCDCAIYPIRQEDIP